MELLFTVVILIFSIIIHEVAHGYAANALGDPTARLAGRLTLNPVPHIDLFGSIILPGLMVFTSSPFLFGWAKPVPYNPYNLSNKRWGEAIVGVAGVATNLAIAVLFALFARYAGAFGMEGYASIAATISFVNLFLGLFNLIPFPPLDGFTVLRGLLPMRQALSLRQFEEQMMRGGMLSLIIFLVLFSYIFARPFAELVHTIFLFLVGA